MKKISLLVLFISLLGCQNAYVPENKIKEDVTFLANDGLEGRQTGTEGEKRAAEYIAQRFTDIGLMAKGTNNYFQEFSFKPKTNPHQKVTYSAEVLKKQFTMEQMIMQVVLQLC
jgi:hypothetical protein